MDLLFVDEEGELLVFLYLSFEFESEVLDGLVELVDDDCFFAGKIEFDNPCDHKFHGFVILFNYCEVVELKGLFEIVKADQGMGVNFGRVHNILSLRVDDQAVVLLLEDKADGMIGGFLFHSKGGRNNYQIYDKLMPD